MWISINLGGANLYDYISVADVSGKLLPLRKEISLCTLVVVLGSGTSLALWMTWRYDVKNNENVPASKHTRKY